MPTASGRRLWGLLKANFQDADQAQAPTCAVASPTAGLAGVGLKPGPSQATSQAPGPGQHPGSVSRHSLGYLGRLDSAHGNGLGDKTSVHDVPEVYCSAEGRPQSTPLSLRKAKPWRHGLERLSLRVHNRRGRLGVPLLPVKRDQKPAPRRGDGTLAEFLFGTHQTSEVAQLAPAAAR